MGKTTVLGEETKPESEKADDRQRVEHIIVHKTLGTYSIIFIDGFN